MANSRASPQNGASMDRTHARRDKFAAMAGGDDDLAIIHLTRAALTAQLAHRFRQSGEIAQMIAREQPAAGIDRNGAAGGHVSRLHEGTALAFLAEAVILGLEQHFGGEAVIELDA